MTLTPQHHPTQGGLAGHIFRRLIHISLALIPVAYYLLGRSWQTQYQFLIVYIAVALLVLITLFELWRLYTGTLLPGHRQHERHQPSSFFWGTVGIVAVLLFSPGGLAHGEQFAIPIIWSCAFVDPVIGELRSHKCPVYARVAIGLIITFVIWWGAAKWLGTPAWLAWLMAPVIVAAERPPVYWLDDNLTLLLIPLVIVLLLYG